MQSVLNLLLTLTCATLLFAAAQTNGTIEGVARRAVRLCGGRAALLPLMFFLLAFLMAMVGPGTIASTAVIAPLAMSAGARAGVPAFLTALMVCNGANAGNLSPFSTVGVIVSGLMTRAGLGGHEFRVWFWHGSAHLAVAAAAYLLFGGLALFRKGAVVVMPSPAPLARRHWLTVAIIGAWIAGVLILRAPLGWSALAAAAVIFALRLADIGPSVKSMPWKIIALVVGISSAITWLERAGGLAWFPELVARWATPRSVHALIAFLTGLISAYSSTSGVVLPAFLPLASGLAARLPGVDALALSISIVIGSALVDVSPMSTIGALAIAAAPKEEDSVRLFRRLLAWGMAMSVVGAALCYFGAPFF